MNRMTETDFEEIENDILSIFESEMVVNDHKDENVPSVRDIEDANHGLILTKCSILFVDIRSSTILSDKSQAVSMAKIYKAFAESMSKCIYLSGGWVRQISGDRVMGVFVEDKENSSATKALEAARSIMSVIEYIYNPLCKRLVNKKTISCGVGIDIGRLLVTKIGIEHDGDDSRDLVWAGRPANLASKHTDLAFGSEIFVTKHFYEQLPKSEKVDANGNPLWNKGFRFKGSNLYEGYSAEITHHDLYIEVDDVIENEHEKDESTPHPNDQSFADVLDSLVRGFDSKLGSLLENNERLERKSYELNEKDLKLNQKEEELRKRELYVANKEKDLLEHVNKLVNLEKYRLNVEKFRNQLNSMDFSEFIEEKYDIMSLGSQIGKSSHEVYDDIYYWKVVNFLVEQGEHFHAYEVIKKQLENCDEFPSFPYVSDVIKAVKAVSKELEYQEVALQCCRRENFTSTPRSDLHKIFTGLNLPTLELDRC